MGSTVTAPGPLSFGLYLSPNDSHEEDPVNLLFRGNATARSLAILLLGAVPRPWEFTRVGGRMRALIKASGSGYWKDPDTQLHLVYPPRGRSAAFVTSRFHLRLYQGAIAGSPDPMWSIGGAHVEHWLPPIWHIVHDWNRARDFIAAQLTSLGASVRRYPLPSTGLYQGHEFDGDLVEVTL